jgi:hypothetical protein
MNRAARSLRLLALFAFAAWATSVVDGATQADEATVIQRLADKGAKITTANGAHSVSVGDCSAWSESDYRALGSVPRVTGLSLGLGFSEASLPLLASLTDLELFATNGMQLTDEGVKSLTQFSKLRRLAFFHPSRTFTGRGLDQLAALKNLEELSIGGSFAVGDEALASISRIKTLKRLRLWHIGNTNEGVKQLQDLPALESLMLGQRLTYDPPACPNDDTVTSLLEMKRLKSLTLMETRLSFSSLARLKQLPDLLKLTLDGVELSNEDFERLKHLMPTVKIDLSKPSEIYQRRIDRLLGQ